MALKIEQMYAFICIDAEGDEGIPAFLHGSIMMPLTGADMTRMDSLRQKAQEIADLTGRTMQLAVFEQRANLDLIVPQQSAAKQ